MLSSSRKGMRGRTLSGNLHTGLIARTVASVRISIGLPFNFVVLNGQSLASKHSVAWCHYIFIALLLLLAASLLGWWVCQFFAERLESLRNLHFENQLEERTRIARDLNDTLLQTIEASKMIADDALDPPADPVRMRRTMSRLSDWLGQATKEGQQALNSLRTPTIENGHKTASPLSLWIRKLSRRLRPIKEKRP